MNDGAKKQFLDRLNAALDSEDEAEVMDVISGFAGCMLHAFPAEAREDEAMHFVARMKHAFEGTRPDGGPIKPTHTWHTVH